MNTDQLADKLNLDASIRQRMALTRAALAMGMTAESLRTVNRKMDEVAQALKDALGNLFPSRQTLEAFLRAGEEAYPLDARKGT